MTHFQRLVLRGLLILMRTRFSPRDPEAKKAHFESLPRDMLAWEADAADALKQPEDLQK